MKVVARGELLDLAAYEQVREQFRRRVIEEKRVRRVAVGDNLSLLFENHDTVLLQIQEMLRTERITKEASILHELETYNQLVPGESELSATAFVEYPDKDERDRMLVALAGLEDRFFIEVDGERVFARNETMGTRTDRTTAVHYLKFPLTESARHALLSGAGVRVGTDHDAYRQAAELSKATLASLIDDFDG